MSSLGKKERTRSTMLDSSNSEKETTKVIGVQKVETVIKWYKSQGRLKKALECAGG